ncbi:MAG: glycerophosphodiester phosphodiesterase family protein [Egibacteraceae bacterium]
MAVHLLVSRTRPDSFAAAAVGGAEWVGLDLRRGRDGTLVVHHDPRTWDGVPLVELDATALAERGVWAFDEILERLPPGLGLLGYWGVHR